MNKTSANTPSNPIREYDNELHARIAQSVAAIRAALSGTVDADSALNHPHTVLVLGSGMGNLANEIENPIKIPYADIPHFNPSGAPTHSGQIIVGFVEHEPVICLQGRTHMYEGYTPQDITYAIFVAAALGVRHLVATNAAGGIREDLIRGDIAIVTDHINFTGKTPCILNGTLTDDTRVYNAFCDMTNAYSPELRARAHRIARENNIELKEGVYIGVHGPQFETPAEIRAYGKWGADLVGMSTVLETIAARSAGMDVVVLSYVSNLAAGRGTSVSVADIFADPGTTAKNMDLLIRGIVKENK